MRTLPDVELLQRYQSPAALRAGGAANRMRAMLRLLPTDQRRLAEMVLLNHVSHRAAAASFRMTPGGVTRRVKTIRARLTCPIRRALFLHLDTLPEPTRSLAVEHFFGGAGCSTLARAFNLSPREVHTQLDYVRGWVRALNRQRRKQAGQTLEADAPAESAQAVSIDAE